MRLVTTEKSRKCYDPGWKIGKGLEECNILKKNLEEEFVEWFKNRGTDRLTDLEKSAASIMNYFHRDAADIMNYFHRDAASNTPTKAKHSHTGVLKDTTNIRNKESEGAEPKQLKADEKQTTSSQSSLFGSTCSASTITSNADGKAGSSVDSRKRTRGGVGFYSLPTGRSSRGKTTKLPRASKHHQVPDSSFLFLEQFNVENMTNDYVWPANNEIFPRCWRKLNFPPKDSSFYNEEKNEEHCYVMTSEEDSDSSSDWDENDY